MSNPRWQYAVVNVWPDQSEPSGEALHFYECGDDLEMARRYASEEGSDWPAEKVANSYNVKNENGTPKFYDDSVWLVEQWREPNGDLNLIVAYNYE